MEAMGNLSQNENSNRMSMRNSLLVWVFGTVLGWAVAVVAVYTLIREEGDPLIASHSRTNSVSQNAVSDQKAIDLNQIEPAAGTEAKTVQQN